MKKKVQTIRIGDCPYQRAKDLAILTPSFSTQSSMSKFWMARRFRPRFAASCRSHLRIFFLS
ncbi:MAG: hypothetical protein C6W57_00330 [Caldibacillus debilis]|nr:MAG: hypothetical protein C6W57_00330 [Caldibacillus debilis]